MNFFELNKASAKTSNAAPRDCSSGSAAIFCSNSAKLVRPENKCRWTKKVAFGWRAVAMRKGYQFFLRRKASREPGTPPPACGHLLPIRCGEGFFLWDDSPA